MSDVFTLEQGTSAVLVSVPHAGTFIPPELAGRFVPRALASEDSDRHLDRLYRFARDIGAGLITSRFSRYVIDLNRPPDNTPMYAGSNNTELVPTRFFTGEPLYRAGQLPDANEIAQRRDRYWRPYHVALKDELERLEAEHGHAIVFDGHSIRSELPWLFEGRLPDLNLGTASGTSCAPSLRTALSRILDAQRDFTHVVDGRFKGGYITRHYGRPAQRFHAVQLEMGFVCYMDDDPPFALDDSRCARLVPTLRRLVETMVRWTPADGE
ncbi:MAG TPA: N-formylglutamate deformylase [Casimicrobiaceae bacterium]|nr:N-formylglutamate deformylase [Casimicrobiaceae bacterium]